MAITKDQLDSFHRFAVNKLESGAAEFELDDLLGEWYDAHERESVNAIIRRGLADIEQGIARPARDVSEELRQKHNLLAQ